MNLPVLNGPVKQDIPVMCDGVSVFLIKGTGRGAQTLLMRRAKTLKGTSCQVTGSIEKGETAWQAAVREVREETGITLQTIWSGDICEQFYEPEKERIALMPVFVGYVEDWVKVRLNDEHDAFEWVTFPQAHARVTFPGQRRTMQHVEKEFARRPPLDMLRIRLS